MYDLLTYVIHALLFAVRFGNVRIERGFERHYVHLPFRLEKQELN
jgi:hypothetical protein